jgi:predicted Ser/Thr protein kinase
MKTLKLIEQYKSLLEQDEIEQVEEVDVEVADATDVADVPEGPQGITPEGEIYVADLLTNAFIYAPKMKDINIAAEVNKEFGRTDPRKVIETIERLIQFSDEPVEQELEDVDAR